LLWRWSLLKDDGCVVGGVCVKIKCDINHSLGSSSDDSGMRYSRGYGLWVQKFNKGNTCSGFLGRNIPYERGG
jgi:hypothetical protein